MRVSHRRAAVTTDRLLLAADYGFAVLDLKGKLLQLWRSDNFCVGTALGGWVRGNCPLPPCSVKDIVPDDSDPDLFWLVSKHDENIPVYNFLWAALPSNALKNYRFKDARSFVTAFRPSKNTFSKPIEIEGGFVHMAPRGDSLYFTGKTLASLPKKLWPTDQTANPDAPLQIDVPDTPFGRASRALLLNHPDEAIQHLQSAIDAHLAPDEARTIIRDLAPQTRPAPSP